MAASSTLMLTFLKPGDELLCSAAIYGGTFRLIHDVLATLHIGVRFETLDQFERPASLLGPKTRMCWVESPINPTLRCLDVARVAKACRDAGVLAVLDNTFASPINQQALALGVDLSMQSATKYLNGHADVTAGVVSGSRALLQKVDLMRRYLGGVLDPMAAFALARGLKTLPVRIARQNETAGKVARFLESDRRVEPGVLPWPGVAPRPCDRQSPDVGFRGHGDVRGARRPRRRLARVRPAPADSRARRVWAGSTAWPACRSSPRTTTTATRTCGARA